MPAPQRVVLFRPRTVLQVAALLLGIALALWIVWVSIRVLTWVFVALFLALALEPGVRFLQQRGMRRRGAAVAVIYVSAFAFLALLAALLVPPLVDEVDGLADAAPGYVEDITAGRGPLGFLQTRLPRRRPRPRRDRVRRRLAARRRRGHGGRHRPRRDHRRLRLHHDRLPDAVHDPRGPDLGGARARPDAARVAPALAQRRPPDRADRLRLRHRQPAALGDRGRLLDDRAADHGRAVRARARPRGRRARPDPARRRDARRPAADDRRLPHVAHGRHRAARLLHPLPADREPRAAAARLRPHGAALAARRADRDPDRHRGRGHPRRAGRDPGRGHPADPAPGLAGAPADEPRGGRRRVGRRRGGRPAPRRRARPSAGRGPSGRAPRATGPRRARRTRAARRRRASASPSRPRAGPRARAAARRRPRAGCPPS